MNLKSFQIYNEIITDLNLATCIKQCVSNVLKMVCREYFDSIIFHYLATKLDGNSIFDNY